VWRGSELFQALRGARLGGKCGRCEYRELCGGCRARAYALEGDYLAADPSCAYQPPEHAELVPRQRSVTYGDQVAATLSWAPEAEERMRRIPSFVRGVVMARLEAYARRQGKTQVTLELVREVRRSMPVDFSRRSPFFASDD
jgi:hypothetical protein